MRAVFFCLLGALVLSSGAAAQVVINEVYTGTPDYVELRNLGAAPVDISGWTVQTFQTSSTGGGTPSAEPVYTIPAGTIIASQEQFLLEENGTANAAGTLGPCAIPHRLQLQLDQHAQRRGAPARQHQRGDGLRLPPQRLGRGHAERERGDLHRHPERPRQRHQPQR